MESVVDCNTKTSTQHSARNKLCVIAGKLCILVFFLCGAGASHAQSGTDYAIHANIIYHFTKYINWPEDKKSGDFVIGVMGETPLYEKLKSLIGSSKAVGSQRIVVRKFTSSQSLNCHILFISEDESGILKKIASGTAASSILLVTESEGLARKGSCINFVIVDERLKLEINKKNIEQRDLDIATELLNLGTIVK